MQNFVFIFILLVETYVFQKDSKGTFFTDVVTRSSFISSLFHFVSLNLIYLYGRKYKRRKNYDCKITYFVTLEII